MIVSEGAVDTVLVFEADPQLRDTLNATIRSEGFHVVAAADVVSAIKCLQDLPGAIDWLIVDLDALGPCKVVHVIHEYRFFHPLRPVIAITGRPILDDAGRSVDLVVARTESDVVAKIVPYLVEFRFLKSELTY